MRQLFCSPRRCALALLPAGAALVTLVALLALLTPARPLAAAPAQQSGPPVVVAGALPGNVTKGGVRYRNFSSGGGQSEVYLGIPANLGTTNRTAIETTWRLPSANPSTNTVAFGYIPATGVLTATANGASGTYNIGSLTPLNTLQIVVTSRVANSTMRLYNVRLNGTLLPTSVFTAASASTATQVRTFSVKGVDLSGGFRVDANLTWTGGALNGETNKVEISAGYVDQAPPAVSALSTAPAPGILNAPIAVTARFSDVLTGNSPITAAQMSLNNGPWLAMTAVDGSFNAPVETATASFTPPNLDGGTVCVRGFDIRANVSTPLCTPYTVTYAPLPITVVKQADVDSGASFPFTWTAVFTTPSQQGITPGGAFSLAGAGAGATTQIAAVPALRHIIREQLPDGWLLGGVFCVDAQGNPAPYAPGAGNSVVITNTAPGGHTCTFANRGPRIVLTATVAAGTACGATSSVTALEGEPLTWCYTVRNAGATALSSHTLVDSGLGTLLNGAAFTLTPGATFGVNVTRPITRSLVHLATWSASVGATSVQATDSVTVTMIPAAPAIVLTKTVGAERATCAATDSLTSPAGAEVAYCYTIANTGNITLTRHTLVDSRLGTLFSNFVYTLAPGASVNTGSLGQVVTANPVVTTTNVATWTAALPARAQAAASDSATVRMAAQGFALALTVGLEPNVCASESTLLVEAGATVYFCYRITNSAATPLTTHALVDSAAGLVFAQLVQTLAPGEVWDTVQGGYVLSSTVVASQTRAGTWTATNPYGVESSATATATVQVGASSIAVRKLAAATDTCAGAPALTVESGDAIYFCIEISNTGAFTFTEHAVSDPQLGIQSTVSRTLAPGATLMLSNDDLPALGPVTVTTSITNTVAVTSSTSGQQLPLPAAAPSAVAPAVASAGAVAQITVREPTADPQAGEPVRVFLPLLAR